ncbi:IS3 family transposase [Pseudomonas oryzihabitans]|uniref:IS3 family transposase n=1 Tax=Pseudomonas oryzihabitans TaxID=47885 RepID=UPI00241C47F3|nr:IS3 family transposase [Pseudomonas oryzihabitans]
MPKYSFALKMRIINDYKKGDCGYGQLAARYLIDAMQIKGWIQTEKRHGAEGLRKRYRYHKVEFKLEVVRQIAEGLSLQKASALFNLNRSQMQRWVRAWQKHGIEGLSSKRRGDSMPLPPAPVPSAFEKTKGCPRRRLEREVAYLQVKTVFLRTAMGRGLNEADLDSRTKTQLVQELRTQYPLDALLQGAGLARSTYYYHLRMAQLPDKNARLKGHIQQVFDRHRGRYGYRRVTAALRSQGHCVNHKAVQRLMGVLSLQCRLRRRRYRPFTGTESCIAPNVLNRSFHAAEPNNRWVTDVTEFRIDQQKLYLSPLMDLFNREIIAFQISSRPSFQMVQRMLEEGLEKLSDHEKPLIHSDQGWHYQTPAYQQTLRKHGLTQSMSRRGNCLDNAAMESFFAVLKSELFHCNRFSSPEQLAAAIRDYVVYYNHTRIKLSLRGRSPVAYRHEYEARAACSGNS